MNSLFTTPCTERYSPLVRLETYLESTLSEITLTRKIRSEATERLTREMVESRTSERSKTLETLQEIDSLQEKLNRLMESYVEERVSQDLFEKLAAKLNLEIEHRKTHMALVDDHKRFIESNKRTIRFLEALSWYESILELPS